MCHRFWVVLLCLSAGCQAINPKGNLFLGTPSCADERNPVYLIHYGKYQSDGNVYTITWEDAGLRAGVYTNAFSWPYRSHLELSVDGGLSWPYRIGYGVQTPHGGTGASFVWSPPMDYSLMSTNAVLRLTTLDGLPFGHRGDGTAGDLPAGKYIQSPPFVIAAMQVQSPMVGDYVYQSAGTDVLWNQTGGGSVVTLSWITQDNLNWTVNKVATFSNCVQGANSRYVSIPNIPLNTPVKFLLVSNTDPQLMGYSGVFSLLP